MPSVRPQLRNDIKVAAQNIAAAEEYGAYTGETMANDVRQAGSEYVILGHSERRAMGETDREIMQKIRVALKSNLNVILCIGET